MVARIYQPVQAQAKACGYIRLLQEGNPHQLISPQSQAASLVPARRWPA